MRTGPEASSIIAQAIRESYRDIDVVDPSNHRAALCKEVECDVGERLHNTQLYALANNLPWLARRGFPFLDKVPFLALPLFQAHLAWAGGKERSTEGTGRVLLRLFCEFLHSTGLGDLRLEDIDRAVITAFVHWLNAPNRHNGKPFALGTRRRAYYHARILLGELALLEQYRAQARRIIALWPMRQWPGADRRSTPTPRLPREVLERIIHAATTEILETARRLNDTQNRSSLFPTSARHLVPYALVVSVATAFNPQSVLALEWSDIEESSLLGEPVIRLYGSKPRSATDPVITVNAQSVNGFGVGMALQTLRAWTIGLQSDLCPNHRDRLFIYAPSRRNGRSRAIAIEGFHGPSSNRMWQVGLKRFCADNGIPQFTLSQIRHTISDEFLLQGGDIRAARVLLNHQSVDTSWAYYSKDGVRQRYVESLGEVFLLRERWRETGGIIDPRDRTAAQRREAATPGFVCFDPFDSPQLNQTPGRLCTAYGRCPSCPLAAACVTDRSCVAAYCALRRAIVEAHVSHTSQAWTIQWAPVLVDIDALLALVPPDVMKHASTITMRLPMVG